MLPIAAIEGSDRAISRNDPAAGNRSAETEQDALVLRLGIGHDGVQIVRLVGLDPRANRAGESR